MFSAMFFIKPSSKNKLRTLSLLPTRTSLGMPATLFPLAQGQNKLPGHLLHSKLFWDTKQHLWCPRARTCCPWPLCGLETHKLAPVSSLGTSDCAFSPPEWCLVESHSSIPTQLLRYIVKVPVSCLTRSPNLGPDEGNLL